MCVSVLALIVNFAQAETVNSQKVSGFYVGGGLGNPSGKFEDNDGDSFDMKMNDTSFHLLAGYQINRVFALEVEYVKYGKDEYKDFDPFSISMSGNVGYTFSSGVRPFLVLGLGVTDLRSNTEFPAGVIFQDDDLSVHYGAGLDYTPGALAGLTFRAAYMADFVNAELTGYNGRSWRQLDMLDVDLNSVYGALIYKF